MKQKFDVIGMSCSSCSHHIEQAVSKLQGIHSVAVNLLSNTMIVDYDDNIVGQPEIKQAVKDAGYDLLDPTENKNMKKENVVDQEIIHMKQRLIISLVFLIPLLAIAMGPMLQELFKIPIPTFILHLFHGPENAITFAFSQFLLLLPIVFVNRSYFERGIKSLFNGKPNMDSLIAIGSGAAILYGLLVIFRVGYGLGHGDFALVNKYSMDIYFESAGAILTLITLGKYLETKSKGKTSEAITKLIHLVPKVATVLRENHEIQIPIEDVILDDVIVMKPGGSIPVDGIITVGNSSIDQSSITGESIPIEKTVGDSVIAGTINKTGAFQFRATKVGNNTTLAQIIQLVEDAGNSKAPIAKLADKISGIFVPIVIVIAILSAIIWILLGQNFEFALSISIAVLVISCPCALGLATPVAIMVGTGKGAEHGILIKTAESLETLHLVNTVVFDKTGTITEGKLNITDIVPQHDYSITTLLSVAGSLERYSEHPLADAILEHAISHQVTLLDVYDFISIPGRGVTGTIENINYYGGNLAFMEENNIKIHDVKVLSEQFAKDGKTPLYFANQDHLIGILVAQDVIKKNSKKAIQLLKDMNIEVILLTGDNNITAQAIRKDLDIDTVIAEVLPQEKEKEIVKLQQAGKKVAMCGDGINDSPSLVRADVGIAIGSGTDIAIESADIVLMKNDPLDVVTAIQLSRVVIRTIKMNLFWAFFYNGIGIPLAAGLFYTVLGWKLNPMFASAAMGLSSLCVVINALRIKKFNTSTQNNERRGTKMNHETLYTKVISIEGMSCAHCKSTIEKTLLAFEGVILAEVDLTSNTATIRSKNIIEDIAIISAIEENGFKVISIR